MKRFLALLLAVGMILSLAACGSSSDEETTDTTSEETEEASEEEEEEAEEETEETEEAEEEASEEETEEETAEAEETSSEAVYGGTVNCYYYNEFNNVYDAASPSNGVVSFFTDCLWSIDWDADRDEFDYGSNYVNSNYMVGQIAESWEIADDNSSITVTIRDDVYFQDKTAAGFDEEYDIYGGRQVTADDVKYSYDRLLGLDGVEQVVLDMSNWDSTMSMLDSVEVVDDYTVTFYFNTTDEISVDNFICAFVAICGPEWDELEDEQKNDWHYASGTGPYIITNYVTDNTMTFTRNENYWDTDDDGNQLPYIDEVNLIYMTDTATLLSSFIAGEIDLIVANGTIFDGDQIEQLTAAMDEDEYTRYQYTADPSNLGLKQGNNPVEALTDVNVRTALQYATDTTAISEYEGYTYESTEQMLSGLFLSGTDWCDVSSWSDELVASYTTYDPDYALELLEEAGYADGFEFDMGISSDRDTTVYELVAQYLSEVGVTMNIEVYSSSTEFQAISTDPDDPTCGPYNCTSSNAGGLEIAFGSSDSVFINDDEIDTLLNNFLTATTVDDQIEAAKELDQTFMSEHYILMVVYNQLNSRWYSGRLQGYSGEDVTKNNYFGYVLARCWVEE